MTGALLNGLDLFTGIGGISEALKDWVRPIAYCERDLYCISVLLERMRSQEIPSAAICTDVRELRGCNLGEIDIIYGGFPCQDISVAGLGAGLEGERSGLFFEIARLAEEIRPQFIFLENVPAIRTRGLREVVRALADLRYDCRWTRISAASVGAPHKRERWFLLAHANGSSGGHQRKSEVQKDWQMDQWGAKPGDHGVKGGAPWASERFAQPRVDRTGDGLPFRMERLKALGNSVVPQQVRKAFEVLIGATA